MRTTALAIILAMVILAVAVFAKAEIIDISEYSPDETAIVWRITPGDEPGRIHRKLFYEKINWKEIVKTIPLPAGMNPRKIPVDTEIKIVGKNDNFKHPLVKDYLSKFAALNNLQKEAAEMKKRIAELEVSVVELEVKNSNLSQTRLEAIELVEISEKEVGAAYQLAAGLKLKNTQLEKNLQATKIAIRSGGALLLAAVMICMVIYIVKNPVRQEPLMTNKTTQTLPQGGPIFLNFELARKKLAVAESDPEGEFLNSRSFDRIIKVDADRGLGDLDPDLIQGALDQLSEKENNDPIYLLNLENCI